MRVGGWCCLRKRLSQLGLFEGEVVVLGVEGEFVVFQKGEAQEAVDAGVGEVGDENGGVFLSPVEDGELVDGGLVGANGARGSGDGDGLSLRV